MTRSVAVGLAILGVAVASHANLLTNGSFEKGVAPGSYRQLNVGSTDITGWKVTSPLDYIGSYWDTPYGDRSLDLCASPSYGSISLEQTGFSTIAGQQYLLTFWMSGNPVIKPQGGVYEMKVGWGDQTLETSFTTFTGHSTTNMGWEKREWYVTGTGNDALSFTSLTYGNCGPALDHVQLTAVPEPSLGLLVFGLVVPLVIGLRRRRVARPAVER